MTKEKNNKTTKPIKISYPLIYLQALLTFIMIILAVITIFNHKMLSWFELSLGITLLDIALNNALFYKRNGGTLLYSMVGIILISLSIIALIGGI